MTLCLQAESKRFVQAFLFLFFLTVQPHLAKSASLFQYHQVAMGTFIEITLIGEDEKLAEQSALQAFQEIKRIEQLMSPKIESGDVFRLNKFAGKQRERVSPETMQVIKKALEISELSDGGFDISVDPLIQIWKNAWERGTPPSSEEIRKNLHLVNFRNILIDGKDRVFLKKKGMAIDLGGIAKGFAVDKAFELLRNLGYKNLIVNAGGDLRVGGSKFDQSWSVGIQHPRIPEKSIARVSASEEAVATSGDYEKFFIHEGKRYHHILNPKNGFPAEGLQSVTVLRRNPSSPPFRKSPLPPPLIKGGTGGFDSHFPGNGMVADALATAIFVLGPEKGYDLCQRLNGVECIIIDQEGKINFSPGLKDRLSLHVD